MKKTIKLDYDCQPDDVIDMVNEVIESSFGYTFKMQDDESEEGEVTYKLVEVKK